MTLSAVRSVFEEQKTKELKGSMIMVLHQMAYINKEIKTINLLEGLSKFDLAQDRTSQHEERSINIIHCEKKEKVK